MSSVLFTVPSLEFSIGTTTQTKMLAIPSAFEPASVPERQRGYATIASQRLL